MREPWKKGDRGLALVGCLLVALLAASGLPNEGVRAAPPGLPASFWGEVRLDGLAAPPGTVVEALVAGNICGRATLTQQEGRTWYTLNVPADDPTTPLVEGGREGEVVTITVGEVPLVTGVWHSGSNVRLDLEAVSVSLASAQWEVDEGAGSLSLEIRLGAAVGHQVQVEYEARPDSAGEEDLSLPCGWLAFAPGETVRHLTMAVVDDPLDEEEEICSFHLLRATGAALGSPTVARVTILDDDPPPTVDFEHSRYVEGEGAGFIEAIVTLSPASGKVVSVNYETRRGSAAPGSDYMAVEGTLKFAPGATRRSIRVPIVADHLAELAESLSLLLSNPQNANLGLNNPATLIILDDTLPAQGYSLYLPQVYCQSPA